MDVTIVAAVGSACLGGVVGWLVRYFISRFETFTHQGLSAVVGVLLGAGIIKFIGQQPDAMWFYPMGLVVGFVAYHLIAVKYIAKDIQNQTDENDGDDGDDDTGGPKGGGGGGGPSGFTHRGPVYAPMDKVLHE